MRLHRLLTLTVTCVAASACSSKSENTTPPTDPVISLGIGLGNHSCAVLASGAVRCWGDNGVGELGNPAGLGAWSRVPVPVDVFAPAKLAAGGGHVCGVLASGSLSCWGWGAWGQLGNGAFSDSVVPVTVTSIATAIDVAAGSRHTCALTRGGSVSCWGSNDGGQLGDPALATTAPGNRFAAPVIARGISGVQSITAGTCQSCALFGDGSVKCWGGPMNGAPPYRHDPVSITSLAGVVSFTSGTCHNCAVVAGGKVKCWGRNVYGQLGNGTVNVDSPTEAVFVEGVDSAIAVAAGTFQSCALLAGGTIACWGRNHRGQLGDGTASMYRSTPVPVTGVTGAVSVATGDVHTCALLTGGTVKCWGDNTWGQLGLDPALVQTSAVPVAITF
jgi:alpha-tubulin suppressor-like RCC1 family protein